MALILEAATGGATRKQIMYNAFVSCSQMDEYLILLTQQGLIEHATLGRRYTTTAKGLQVFQIRNQLNKELETMNMGDTSWP
ncbi:MAG TPA: winged helix-turn-helix domain-containing protein [Nitrososphaeraceae archaeon]